MLPHSLSTVPLVSGVCRVCVGRVLPHSYVDTIDGQYNHALRVSTRMENTKDRSAVCTMPNRKYHTIPYHTTGYALLCHHHVPNRKYVPCAKPWES